MKYAAVIFLVMSAIAGFLGTHGSTVAAAELAKAVCWLFMSLFAMSALAAILQRRAT
jgi:uncharacterized membrane protein YtjA (UPF0391 family)